MREIYDANERQKKDKEKERRKARDELFKAQKEQKLARLEELRKKASEFDITNDIDAEKPTEKSEKSPKNISKKVAAKITKFSEETEDENYIPLSKKSRSDKIITSQHGSTNFRVVSKKRGHSVECDQDYCGQ